MCVKSRKMEIGDNIEIVILPGEYGVNEIEEVPFEPQEEEFPVEPQQSEEDNVVKIQKTTSTMSRKRICLPEQWKRNIAKKSR